MNLPRSHLNVDLIYMILTTDDMFYRNITSLQQFYAYKYFFMLL